MTSDRRSAFQQQVVEELLKSKAIDLAAVGATMSKFGERAVRDGESLVAIINRHTMWACGWPGPELDIIRGEVTSQLGK
jgi:hypothetical protein